MDHKPPPKKKLRSPNCPTISLTEALQKARKVYEEEHTHPADKQVVAQDLGYTSISGASATAIGALRQYGVLEAVGDGLRISEDAVAAFELPDDSPEKAEALRRMAFNPSLFEELRAQFPDRLPGDANLRHLLIKKGFLSKTADEVIQTYKENFQLVGSSHEEYNRGEDPSQQMQEAGQQTTQSPVRRLVNTAIHGGIDPAAVQARSYAFDISIPRQVKGELRIVGQFGKEDLERLKKALNGQLAMIEAALED